MEQYRLCTPSSCRTGNGGITAEMKGAAWVNAAVAAII